MTASGATDGSGSGVKEYMYFVDNKAGASDTIVRKTVGTDSNPNVASFTANMGRYLGQVAVVDKAGNVSNVQGDPDARTKMYAYNVSSNMLSKQLYVSPVNDQNIYRLGTSGPATVCVHGKVENGCVAISWAYRQAGEMTIGEPFISLVYPGSCDLAPGFHTHVNLQTCLVKHVQPTWLGVFKRCDSWNIKRVGELIFSDPTSTTSNQIRRGFQ